MGVVFNKGNINLSYSLAKGRDGKWVVGMWVNDTLYSRDGSNKKLCKRDEMTLWKFFKEVKEYESSGNLKIGEKVLVSEEGRSSYYYVIDQIHNKDKSINSYYIGV